MPFNINLSNIILTLLSGVNPVKFCQCNKSQKKYSSLRSKVCGNYILKSVNGINRSLFVRYKVRNY
jgi:hypothetical protein